MGYSSVKAGSKEYRLPILSPWGEKFTVSHVEAATSITNVIRRVNSEHPSAIARFQRAADIYRPTKACQRDS
jgi:hypothetical protein